MAQKKKSKKTTRKPSGGTSRGMQTSQVVMGIIGILIILSMVLSLVKF